MRGKRYSTLSRSGGLVIVLFLAAFLAASPLAGGHHLSIEGVEVFLTVIGRGTADPFALSFDKDEIILGPTPVFVNVTFIHMDAENALIRHNFTTFLNGTFYETPLLDLGETGWVEFWINETGRFPYWCAVVGHRDAGMVGFFVVTDTGAIGGPGEVPSGIEIRAYWVGLIGIFAMVAVILVSYFVIKYESQHHTDQREHRRRRLP